MIFISVFMCLACAYAAPIVQHTTAPTVGSLGISHLFVSSGGRIDFVRWCATEEGVLSKSVGLNAMEIIWVNGSFVKNVSRFVTANDAVTIFNSTVDDSGDYTWTCSYFGVSTMRVVVRNRIVKSERVQSDVGLSVMLWRPCLTEVGSFSKRDKLGKIWSNGLVAEDTTNKFEYDNRTEILVLKSFEVSDSGEYVWICDETCWESVVSLALRDDLSKDVVQRTNGPVKQFETRPVYREWWFASAVSAPIGVGAILLAICGVAIHNRCNPVARKDGVDVLTSDKCGSLADESVELRLDIDDLPTYLDAISADPPVYSSLL